MADAAASDRAAASRSPGERLGSALRLAGRAVALTWRSSPPLIAAIVVLLLIQALLSPLQLFLSRQVLDRAALDLHLAARPDPLAASLPLATWIVLAGLVLALGQMLGPVAFTLEGLAGDRLTGRVTEQLLQAAGRWRGLARFEDPALADDLHRARTKAARGGFDVLLYGTQGGVEAISVASYVAILAGLHPLAPFVVVLAALPSTLRQWEYGARTYGYLYQQTPEARRLEYLRDTLLDPEPAKDVRLYGLGPVFRRRYEAIYARAFGGLERLRRRLLGSMLLTGALAALAAAGIYIYLVLQIIAGSRTVGDLLLYGGAAALLQGGVQSLAQQLGNLAEPLSFLPSLFRVLDAPPDLPLPAAPRPLPRPLRHGVAFEHVAFRYPGAAEPALRDVSFRLAPSESLALVGHNGAGKTTIVKLLLRLYDPTGGRITLDGVDLREYDLDELRRQMAVIFQDFVRYELTAAENVAVGDLTALADPPRLERAVAEAGAADLIARLPQGLATPLGRTLGGRELSGGEWQKLALARAFVRDCPLLVLDEPTAALDVRTEHEVYARFHELTRDRMTLLISHRFATVRMADRILSLADGAIREEGSHEELLARGGEYARLYRLQARQYLEEAAGEVPRA